MFGSHLLITFIPEGKRSIIICSFDGKSKTHSYNIFKMDKVINLEIPHVGELIFESYNTPGLFQCALVSETWKILAENVLIKRVKNLNRKTFDDALLCKACDTGRKDVVQLLWFKKFFFLFC
mgnify:CR=1 FL=1